MMHSIPSPQLSSKQVFEQMYQYMDTPALLIGSSGQVECYNSAFLKMFHNGGIEIGKTPLELVFDGPLREVQSIRESFAVKRALKVVVRSFVKSFVNQQYELFLSPVVLHGETYYVGLLFPLVPIAVHPDPELSQFRLLADNSNDFLALLDHEGAFLYTSPAITRILGYHHDELAGDRPYDFIHPDDQERMVRNYQMLIKKGSVLPTNYRFRHKNGHYVWVESSMQIAPATAQSPLRTIIITRDIEERMNAWKAQLNAEEALLASEMRYKILTEVTNQGVLIHRNGYVVDINPALQRMIGLTDEEFKGKAVLDFIHPDSKPMVLHNMQSGYNGTYEVLVLRKDGSHFVSELTVKNMVINDENFRVATLTDLTDRIRHEKQVRDSEERFRGIFDNAIAGIAFADEHGRILLSNSAFSQLLDYEVDELNGFLLCDLAICESEVLCHQSLLSCLIDNQVPGYVEKRLMKKDGSIVWVNLSLSMIPATERTPVYLVAVVQDITAKKKNEVALIEALDYNRTINQTSPVGIITTNARGKITFANYKAERMLGLSRNSASPYAYQLPKWQFRTKDGKPMSAAALPFMQVRQLRKPIHGCEHMIVLDNGHQLCLSVNAAPIMRDGEFFGMIATFEDITEKIKKDRELIRSYEKMSELNATKDKFFSIIAHDLRSPLANLFSLTELLHKNYREYDESTTTELIQLLYENSSRTYLLLENLLTWSRSQCNKLTFNPVMLSLFHMVDDTIQLLSSGIIQKNIALVNLCDRQIDVLADQAMLSIVIRNLLTNAVKFSHPGSAVEIKTFFDSRYGDKVVLAIADQGTGMTPEMKDKLFKIGQQASHPGTQGEQGTGLGLMLCKEFVEKHGGKIWVESALNEGSTFYVTLPMHPVVGPQSRDKGAMIGNLKKC
ncbi:MAG: PAS domain S-box protein [Marinilabiliaceae bacterium]|nr:PAS domain S-box protein [Marinilabiliaceae bacterium]